jgi:hypothetical protein
MFLVPPASRLLPRPTLKLRHDAFQGGQGVQCSNDGQFVELTRPSFPVEGKGVKVDAAEAPAAHDVECLAVPRTTRGRWETGAGSEEGREDRAASGSPGPLGP